MLRNRTFWRTLLVMACVVVGVQARVWAQGPPIPVQDTCKQVGPWSLPTLPLPGKFVAAEQELLRRCPLNAVVVVRLDKVTISKIVMEQAWLNLDRGKLQMAQMVAPMASFKKIRQRVSAELGAPSKIVFRGPNATVEWDMKAKEPVIALLTQNTAGNSCKLTLLPYVKP